MTEDTISIAPLPKDFDSTKKDKATKKKHAKKNPPGVDPYTKYMNAYRELYESLNRGVEGGRKPSKKNRRTGNNWVTQQRIFTKKKHNHTHGRRRRGNN